MGSVVYRLRLRACIAALAFASALLTVVAENSQVLIPMDSAWRYESTGTNLGSAWVATNYDDSGWPLGRALLGYETSELYLEPIRTELNLMSADGTNQVTTYYFRSLFNFPTNPAGVRLIAGVLLDDGAVFHLNGTEVGRIRVTGQFGPEVNQYYETYYEVLEFSAASLTQGENLLAVEIHQNVLRSSDVMFGLTLVAVWPDPIVITDGPTFDGGFLSLPTSFRVQATGSQPTYQWLKNGQPIPTATNQTYTIDSTQLSHAGDYSVAVSNSMGSVSGGPITLTPQPDPALTNPPDFVSVRFSPTSTNGFNLTFSEILERTSATNIANYSITEDGAPFPIARVSAGNPLKFIRVQTVNDWQPLKTYRVSVQGVKDLAGNVMQGIQSLDVGYYYSLSNSTILPLEHPWRFWWQPLYDDHSHWFGPYPGVMCSSNVSGLTTPVLPLSRTIYFRTTFVMPSSIPGPARLRVIGITDNAALFYLNGVPFGPSYVQNPPPLSYNDFAGPGETAGQPNLTLNYSGYLELTNLLRPGTNILAAELHQSGEYYWSVTGAPLYRPDVAFAAGLEGWVDPGRQIGPLRWTREGSELVLSWSDADAEIQSADSVSGPWEPQPTKGNSYRHPLSGSSKFFRLRERGP
jgi:hypothetical protein